MDQISVRYLLHIIFYFIYLIFRVALEAETDCGNHCHQCDYIGTVNSTVDGKKCIDWTSVKLVKAKDKYFPDGSVSRALNYCRNPSSMRTFYKAWCFTSPYLWESCDTCEGGYTNTYKACKLIDQGTNYNGFISITMSGHNCITWTEAAQKYKSYEDKYFPEKNATLASNYCRNPTPGKAEGTWCYSNSPDDKTPWEYCDICNPFRGSWTKTNSYKWSLTSIIKITGLNNCLTYCIQIGSCKGIDYNKNKRICYWKTDLSGNLVYDVEYIHYEINRICHMGIDYSPNSAIGKKILFGRPIIMEKIACYGGTYVYDINTYDKCIESCFEITSCRFIEFHNQNSNCYYFTGNCYNNIYEKDASLVTLMRCDNTLAPVEDILPILTEKNVTETITSYKDIHTNEDDDVSTNESQSYLTAQDLDLGDLLNENLVESSIKPKDATLFFIIFNAIILIAIICTTVLFRKLLSVAPISTLRNEIKDNTELLEKVLSISSDE